MKLFENKVGRPSDEVISKRRKFIIISISLVLVFIFGLSFTMQINNNVSKNKLKGSLSNSSSITYELLNNDNTNGKDIAYEEGKYEFKVKIKNSLGKTYYYKWFLYSGDNTAGTVSKRGICKEFNKSISFKTSITIDSKEPNRVELVKVYDDKSSCESDTKGISIKDVVEKEKIKLSLSKIKVSLTNLSNNVYNYGSNNVVNSYGKYNLKLNLYNYDKLTYYFRVFEFNALDAEGSIKSSSECLAFNKNLTKKYDVELDKNNKNKSMYLKIYNDMNSCKLDKSNNISKNIIYTNAFNYTYNSYIDNDFIKVRYNIKQISKHLGTQAINKPKQASLAYGTYILTDGKKIASKIKNSDSKYGAYTSNYYNEKNIYDTIKDKLTNGIPVALNINRNGNSSWVLVVGINKDKETSSMTISDLYIIDPYNCEDKSCYNNKKVTLYDGILSSRSGITGLYQTTKNNSKYYSITTWENAKSAK